jgi:TM2 domain-containing membrane protein YozV
MSQGSAGNVIAAICSIIYPGLGQLTQGRFIPAAIFFILGSVLWFVALGWIIHLLACYEAAVWRAPRRVD